MTPPGNNAVSTPDPVKTMLAQQPTLILDGGLATELENRGARLDHALWSAKLLVDQPQLIEAVHLDFLRAGADIITSASYQASRKGFQAAGYDANQADEMMRLSVRLASQARAQFLEESSATSRLRPLVAASAGPYGASLADGSEYHGNYGISRAVLVDFHGARLDVLADTSADLVAFETVPSLLEAEAIMEALDGFPQVFAWLSFSCRNAEEVCHGERFSQCARIVAEHPQMVGVGVNCSNPADIAALLQSAGEMDKPKIAYPNSGERWDAARRSWRGTGAGLEAAQDWMTAGARVIGGCCRVGPQAIATLRESLLR